jgi:hypothetical protein
MWVVEQWRRIEDVAEEGVARGMQFCLIYSVFGDGVSSLL